MLNAEQLDISYVIPARLELAELRDALERTLAVFPLFCGRLVKEPQWAVSLHIAHVQLYPSNRVSHISEPTDLAAASAAHPPHHQTRARAELGPVCRTHQRRHAPPPGALNREDQPARAPERRRA